MDTRKTIFASVVVVLLIALGAWWYFGFSLDFMRFFAAEPGVTDVNIITRETCVPRPACMDANPPCAIDLAPGAVLCPEKVLRQPIPEGCQLRQVQCIQAPCPPVVECPRVSCVAEKTTITAGNLVNILAYGGSGGYAFTAPEGTMAMYDASVAGGAPNMVGVKYDTPGIKQVLVTSKRASDATKTDVAACPITVIAPVIGNY